MAIVKIWKVYWFATMSSDPVKYYFKDENNIELMFKEWTPPYPISSYIKASIEVSEDSWEYIMCID